MQELVKDFERARLDLTQTVSEFPKEKREELLFDKWSLKNLLSHLSGWAKHQIDALERLKKGDEIQIPKNLKNSINTDFVSEREDWGWDKVYQEFLESSERLAKKYKDLPKDLWRKKVHKDAKTTVEDFIKIEINHYKKTHGPQIRKALKVISLDQE